MIVWRGMGVLALLVAVVINLLVNEAADAALGVPTGFQHYHNAHPALWLVGMGLSAVACWFMGRWLEARELRKAKVLQDPATGESVRLLARHDMFWIPVKWWAVIWSGLGVALWLA